jgi:hypothetical protein
VNLSLAFTGLVASRDLLDPAAVESSELFELRPNPGAAKAVGTRPDQAVVGRLLEPSNVFRQELSNQIPELGGQRPPWGATLSTGDDALLSARLVQFPPASLCVTVRVDGLTADGAELAPRLIALQGERTRAPVSPLFQRSLGLMLALDHRSHPISDMPRTLCATELRPRIAPTEIGRWSEDRLPDLVGALIRSNPRDLNRDVIGKIASDCAEINEKSITAYTLITRQGLVHITSDERPSQPDFAVLVELQRWALAVRELLESFRARRVDAPDLYDFYLEVARGLVDDVDLAIPNSFGSARIWQRLIEVYRLKKRLEDLLDEPTARRIDAKRDVFATLRSGYWLDRELETRLAQDLSERDPAHRFAFVADEELRRIVARDLVEARTCLRARAFKGALVLAGSVAETLLLSAMLRLEPTESKTLQAMGLHELVTRAKRSAVLDSKQSTLKLIDEWLRGYR